MTIANLGINDADFQLQAFEDFKQSITRTPRTKTISNETGSPTYTNGTNETIYGIFRKRTKSHQYEDTGVIEQADAFLQILINQSMNREDLITVNGEVFRVDSVIIRTIGDEQMFKSVNLFYY